MSGKLPLVLVTSLALVSVVAAHSVEKRQTTVNANPLSFLAERFYQRAASRTIAGVTLEAVAGIVLMLIALDLIFTFLLVGGTAIGKRSYEEDNSWSSWLGLSSMTGVMRNMYNSLDIVETGFRYMDIEDESCRLKTICELESYAVSHPLASLAINTINSSLRGLERYQTAIQAGINGEDCALIYDQCRVSYVGY